MTLTRRDMLRIAGGASLVPLLNSCRDLGPGEGGPGNLRQAVGAQPPAFVTPLPIPSVLAPTSSDATTDYYDIVARAANVPIIPGTTTQIWGYNGTFPGPTLVGRKNRRMVVRHRNDLPVPTVVHLHGGKVTADSDGYPIDYILPAGGLASDTNAKTGGHGNHGGMDSQGVVVQGTRDYVYPHNQQAATLWYHDHRMDFTGPQVWRGLAGFHLVHDTAEENLPLPKGSRDIPLMICDRAYNANGSLWYPSIDPSLLGEPGVTDPYMGGVLGDVILVNGAPWPVLDVAKVRYRFRILNASNARRYRLALSPAPSGSSFVQVGSDAGLLSAPVNHSTVTISPGERYEVIIDFSSYPIGTVVTLTNQLGSGSTANVMRFRVTSQATDDSTVPAQLVPIETLTRSQAVITRNFDFDSRASGWSINGRVFDPNRIDFQSRINTVELWRINTDTHHPVHLHMAHFQVLSRNGQPPGALDRGWKDTVNVISGQETEILVKFSGYTGKFVYHCHNLEHEDMAMMANLQII